MKKRATIIRTICYLLMLAAVLAWPVWQIIQADLYQIPPQKFLLPVQSTEKNEFCDHFKFTSGFLEEKQDDSGKRDKVFFISSWCVFPVPHTSENPVSKP